jgi:hypothetical protein
MNPSRFWGNMSLLWSVGFFAVGVFVVRRAGWLFAPTF